MPNQTLEELRAAAIAAAEALRAAEEAEANPPLSVEDAQAQLTAATEALEAVERPFWDYEHAIIAVNQAGRELEYAVAHGDEDDIAKRQANLATAQEALAAAKVAFDAHPATRSDIDAAAQAVLDARAALARAEENA